MDQRRYYHMFANGDDARNFITTEAEFKSAFNRFGVCAFLTGAVVVSFSVEDSHPHSILFGTYEVCLNFKTLFERMSIKSIVQHRGSADGVRLYCELAEISDEAYLMNAAAYTIVQATKDGKAVMPYDYLYGSGALYFRSSHSVLPWLVDDNGKVSEPLLFGNLNYREKKVICCSRAVIPDEWLVCNGFILPTNYVDIRRFESIYRTHNCFRAFLSSGKKRDEQVLERMASVRGIMVEDIEARRIGEEVCMELFGQRSSRHLDVDQRLRFAQSLRSKYCLSFRQLSFLVRIPEIELRKFIR